MTLLKSATDNIGTFDKENADIRYSLREIVDDSGAKYGIGVYLDSTLLTNLTDKEKIQMVKEYVKELGGNVFTAYDEKNNAVNITIAKSNQKFENASGTYKLVNKDLTSYLGKKVKQEVISLIDELVITAKYVNKKKSVHTHGWLDNNGANDWEYWKTYVQDKENAIWEATLNIANSTNGEKILYDIVPIKKMGQSVTSDRSTTANSISQDSAKSQEKFSMRENIEETKDLVAVHNLSSAIESTKKSTQKNTDSNGGVKLQARENYWYPDISKSDIGSPREDGSYVITLNENGLNTWQIQQLKKRIIDLEKTVNNIQQEQ